MSAGSLLSIYFSVVFLGGAMVAPWVWHAVQGLEPVLPALHPIADQPFHRYVNRCLLILALAGLWPLFRRSGIRSRAGIGWIGPWARPLIAGSTLGLLAMGGVAAIAISFGGRLWIPPTDFLLWLRRIASAAGSAVVVACMEELLFRGFLHGLLRRSHGFLTSAAASSAVYAWVHFFERPPQAASVDAWTGITTLGQMLRGFTDLHSLLPGWLSLVVAGGLLALARERTGSLAFAIGLHAGWIFWLKVYGFATAAAPAANAWIWGSGRLFDGWVAFGLMIVQAVVVAVLLQPNRCPTPPDSRTPFGQPSTP
jgi:uncharacterized protein